MDNKANYKKKQLLYDKLLKISLIVTPILIISVVILLVLKIYSLLMIILTVLFLLLMSVSVYFASESKKYFIKYKKQAYLDYANKNDLILSRVIRAYDSKLFINELKNMNLSRIKHNIDIFDDKIVIDVFAMYQDYFIEIELDEEELGFEMGKVSFDKLVYTPYSEFITNDQYNQSFKIILDRIEHLILTRYNDDMKIIIEE